MGIQRQLIIRWTRAEVEDTAREATGQRRREDGSGEEGRMTWYPGL